MDKSQTNINTMQKTQHETHILAYTKQRYLYDTVGNI